MSHRLLLVLLLLVAAPLGGFHAILKQQPSREEVRAIAEVAHKPAQWRGLVAPDFEVPTLEGERFRLSEHVGREVLILNFFATWCGPCREEMPELDRLARSLEGRPFRLLAIDVQEKPGVVADFIRELGVRLPVATDESGEVAKRFGVESFPTTVLVGADARIQFYQMGAIRNADVAFSSLIEPNLAQIQGGHGVGSDAYLAAARQESYPQARESSPTTPLPPRAEAIAEKMPCPCGCDDTVHKCGCKTARAIKQRLLAADLGQRTDAEVMTELNKEFCMRGMK